MPALVTYSKAACLPRYYAVSLPNASNTASFCCVFNVCVCVCLCAFVCVCVRVDEIVLESVSVFACKCYKIRTSGRQTCA